MRGSGLSVALSVAVSVLFVAGAARAEAARDFPIHFDGPSVSHGTPIFGVRGNPVFTMRFHGGPVQLTTTSYTIFWRPSGTFMSKRYAALMNQYLADAGGTTLYGVATGYPGSNGTPQNSSTFGGSWTDTSPYPAHFSSSVLDNEIASAIKANNWPVGLGSQFFLFTAKDAVKNVNYCAYHTAFNLAHNKQQPVVYAFVPYVGDENGCDPPYGITPNHDVASDGSIESVEHEQMEMVTDPLLNAWYDNHWGEVADVCIFSFGFPFGPGAANFVVGKDRYFIQEIYSQTLQGCQPNL